MQGKNRKNLGLFASAVFTVLYSTVCLAQPAETKAIQAELSQFRTAKIPGKTIEITEPLRITTTLAGGIVGNGAGSLYPSNAPGYPTRLKYVGPKTDAVITVDMALGCVFEGFELDCNGRADIGIKIIDSSNKWGAGFHRFEKVYIRNAEVAIQCGQNSYDLNCSDNVFDQCGFLNCGAAFRSMNSQSVNNSFRDCTFQSLYTVFDLQFGGNLTATGGHYGRNDTIIRIGQGGPNVAQNVISGARFEMNGKTRRYTVLADARPQDMCKIRFDGCQETDGQVEETLPDNSKEPLIILGRRATVVITNHHSKLDRPVSEGEGILQHDETAWQKSEVWSVR
jgi:hypothetical protein